MNLGTGNRGTMGLVIAATVMLLMIPVGSQAQSNPYVAVFAGKTNANWSSGGKSEELDWRGLQAVEVGFQLFGLTISPGFMDVGEIEWEVPTATTPDRFSLKYRTFYLNVGAREDFGVFFAGGLNYTLWDRIPQPPDGSIEFDVRSQIGFQAFLGFVVSLETLPVKLLLEVGYAQFSGELTPLPAGAPADLFQALSTGPMVRIGFAIGN